MKQYYYIFSAFVPVSIHLPVRKQTFSALCLPVEMNQKGILCCSSSREERVKTNRKKNKHWLTSAREREAEEVYYVFVFLVIMIMAKAENGRIGICRQCFLVKNQP